jgi:peptidoglycan/LPS O-acetylase OafA/YrhL
VERGRGQIIKALWALAAFLMLRCERMRSIYQSRKSAVAPLELDYLRAYSTNRISRLDGWRGISILLVVVGHLIIRRYSPHPDVIVPSIAPVLSDWGANIFFVISGFIITKLALREVDRTGCFSIANFYTRRLFRIIPPLFVYLGSVILASNYALIAQLNSETLTAAAFVCNFRVCGWFAGHTWTLAFEAQFYIIFPLLFVLVGRYAKPFLGTTFIVIVAFPHLRTLLHLGGDWRAVEAFMPTLSFLCAGTVIAAYENEIERLSRKPYAIYISYTSGLLLMSLLIVNSTFDFPLFSRLHYIQISLNNALLPVCLAWLIGSSVHQSNFATKMLTMPPLLALGTISYSLYLWQQLFTAAPSLYISDSLLLIPPLMLIVATASYYLVERPFIKLGKAVVYRLHDVKASLALAFGSTSFAGQSPKRISS